MSSTSEPPTKVPVFVFADPESRLFDRARLRGLRDLGIAAGTRSESLDRITRLAAIGTDAVASLVVLVDGQRQYFPGAYGLPEELEAVRQTPLSRSLCQFVVINDAPLLISDVGLREDLRRMLPGLSPDVAAYAGYPLHDPYGNVLGALCVVDSSPHYWAPNQLAVLEDLATRVENELALRLRTREAQVLRGRLQRTIDAAASIAIVAADSDGVIVLANSGAEMLLGQRAEDLIGKKRMEDLSRPGDPDGEWHIEDTAGGRRVVGVRQSVLLDDEGEIDGYLLIGEDMTARRVAEEELRKASEEHEVFEHAKRDFVATASHELRTPLASVLGYTELLLDGAAGLLTSSQQRLVEPIERNGRRLFDLVEDILLMDQSRTMTSAHTHRPVGLGSVVARVWQRVQPVVDQRELRAQLQLEPNIPEVRGDVAQLERALLHLLINAMKFTPDGGGVSLLVTAVRDEVAVVVSDTGMGIAEEELQGLFTPFSRGKEARTRETPGAGIGLVVVQRVVRLHGGRLSVYSTLGTGTTVTMWLPAMEVGGAPLTGDDAVRRSTPSATNLPAGEPIGSRND